MNKIKKFKPLVWLEVVKYGENSDILYWEGLIEDFRKKLENDYIILDRHGGRTVSTSRIKEFGQVEHDSPQKIEIKLSGLTEKQKKDVKDRIKLLKVRLGREATEQETNKIIDFIKNGLTEEEKTERKIEKESNIILKMKCERKIFLSKMTDEEIKKLENEIWEKIKNINEDYYNNRDKLGSKSLYVAVKNGLIDNLQYKKFKNEGFI